MGGSRELSVLFFSSLYLMHYKVALLGLFLVAVPSYPFPAIGHPVGVNSPRIIRCPPPSRSVFSCLPLRPLLRLSFLARSNRLFVGLDAESWSSSNAAVILYTMIPPDAHSLGSEGRLSLCVLLL